MYGIFFCLWLIYHLLCRCFIQHVFCRVYFSYSYICLHSFVFPRFGFEIPTINSKYMFSKIRTHMVKSVRRTNYVQFSLAFRQNPQRRTLYCILKNKKKKKKKNTMHKNKKRKRLYEKNC